MSEVKTKTAKTLLVINILKGHRKNRAGYVVFCLRRFGRVVRFGEGKAADKGYILAEL